MHIRQGFATLLLTSGRQHDGGSSLGAGSDRWALHSMFQMCRAEETETES